MNTNQQIIYLGTAELKPYEKNAKKHPAEQIAKIVESIKRFGFNQPIVVDKDYVVIVGHGRLAAAKALSLEKVPVIVVDISKEDAASYRLADNKLNESDWDMDLVIDELKTLTAELVELSGFSPDLLLDEEEQDDVVPEDVPTVSNPGDLWFMGGHKLLCGDSTNQADVERLMKGTKADLIFTDPPYNVDYKGSGEKTSEGIMNDKMSTEAFELFLFDVFTRYAESIKAGAGAYVFHSEKTPTEFRLALDKAGFEVKSTLIWNKPAATLGMNDYRSKHEPFFYCALKGAKPQFYGDRTHTSIWDLQDDEESLIKWAKRQKRLEAQGKATVWTMKREKVNEYVHPTQKPVDLIVYALSNSSKAGDIVLDFFGGSGSTLIACEKANRTCYSMELDPKYVDTILERYYLYTGETPVREDGKTWAELRGFGPADIAQEVAGTNEL